MTTIDERGSTAAATLRATLADDFDVDAGLAQVRAEQDLVDVSDHESPRHSWMFAVAAAVTIGLVGAGVLALQNRDTDVNVTDTTTLPTTPDSTTPAASTTVAPSTTVETTVTTPVPTNREVVVADVVETVEPVSESVATLGVGSGPGQLAAVEDCQECEPARPWAPVQLLDGGVLIADTVNGRWLLVEPTDAAPVPTTEVPWPPNVIVSEQPMADDAGTVYAVMTGDFGEGQGRTSQLWVMNPDNLAEPLSNHPMPSIGGLNFELTPTHVLVQGSPVDGQVTPVMSDRPTVEYIAANPVSTQDSTKIRVTWNGTATSFNYAPTDYPSYFGPMPGLADGSVMVSILVDGQWFVDRLTPDGQVRRMALPPDGSEYGAAWVDGDGFYRLETSGDPWQWDLVHYALP